MASADPPMLDINNLSSMLMLEMDRPPMPRQGILLNRFEQPDAKILSATMEWPTHYNNESDGRLTEEEMELCAIKEPTITLCSKDYEQTFEAPNGKWFSVREALRAIADYEKVARTRADWFGGVDNHHIFFEGLAPRGNGRFVTLWGS